MSKSARLFKYLLFCFLVVPVISLANTPDTPKSCVELLQSAPDDAQGGLVTAQVDFSVEALIEAYSNGIFPWKDLGHAAEWYRPATRGVLFIDQYHVGKNLRRLLNKQIFEVTFDQAFGDVIRGCRRAHAHDGEWISDRFVDAYIGLHKVGHAHSVEVWSKNPQTGQRELAGGLYGVFMKGVFTGESMFRNLQLGERSDGASKVAVHALVERLKAKGHTWMDTQMVTGATGPMGAQEVPREEFMRLLRDAQTRNLSF